MKLYFKTNSAFTSSQKSKRMDLLLQSELSPFYFPIVTTLATDGTARPSVFFPDNKMSATTASAFNQIAPTYDLPDTQLMSHSEEITLISRMSALLQQESSKTCIAITNNIIVTGKMNEQMISFISYYAQNVRQIKIFSHMFEILLPQVIGQGILEGDSNIPLDHTLDKSNPSKTVIKHLPKQSCKTTGLLHHYDFIDCWRENNPSTRDYTHYSNVHCTYSRIDHLFKHLYSHLFLWSRY